MLCFEVAAGRKCAVVQRASLRVAPCNKVKCSHIAGKPNKSGQQMDVWENFRDYNLTPPVGLIRADAHRLPFRPALQVLAATPLSTIFALCLPGT